MILAVLVGCHKLSPEAAQSMQDMGFGCGIYATKNDLSETAIPFESVTLIVVGRGEVQSVTLNGEAIEWNSAQNRAVITLAPEKSTTYVAEVSNEGGAASCRTIVRVGNGGSGCRLKLSEGRLHGTYPKGTVFSILTLSLGDNQIQNFVEATPDRSAFSFSLLYDRTNVIFGEQAINGVPTEGGVIVLDALDENGESTACSFTLPRLP